MKNYETPEVETVELMPTEQVAANLGGSGFMPEDQSGFNN